MSIKEQLVSRQSRAHIIYCTGQPGGTLALPSAWQGKARVDQMNGLVGENLCEFAGRICYDSLGQAGSRSSDDYHRHILDVGHGSVLEHYNITVMLKAHGQYTDMALNKPGVWFTHTSPWDRRVTFNLRSLVDWKKHTRWFDVASMLDDHYAFAALLSVGMLHAPRILGRTVEAWSEAVEHGYTDLGNHLTCQQRQPENDEERWVSMVLTGTRGWSHAMVRHKYRTAISQRSTLFCNEEDSDWLEHPLLTKFRLDEGTEKALRLEADHAGCDAMLYARRAYTAQVHALIDYLRSKGVSASQARKQARGAARGMLGNALETEMVFSASVKQWRRMILARASVHDDAEYRLVLCDALRVLKESHHRASFADMELVPSPDGIGEVVAAEGVQA